MKILTFSTLYPNAARPIHGIFVEARLRELVASGQVESKVIAPIPWFPSRHPLFGDYAVHAHAPREEWRHGIEVLHPRYPAIPKIGMSAAPFLLAYGARSTARRLLERHAFELIDAHYFYPDGVAAVLLGNWLSRPVVITARGSDINLIARYALPRRLITWAARHAARVITVSRALKDRLTGLGVPQDSIQVLRNGVDLQFFKPLERDPLRQQLGMTRKTLLSVGNLLEFKGHGVVIRAISLLPDCDLVIAGDGPDRSTFEAIARESGVTNRVRFIGAVSQETLRSHYSAADALVHASSREGWPNVLLEALACGTPVVAMGAGGVPEIVSSPEAGRIMRERTPQAVACAVNELFCSYPDRTAIRRHAEQFGWSSTTRGQLELFNKVISASTGLSAMQPARAS